MAALAMQHAVELDRGCAEFADDLERLQRRIPYQHAELLQARYLLRGPCIVHAAMQNVTLLHPRLVWAAHPAQRAELLQARSCPAHPTCAPSLASSRAR